MGHVFRGTWEGHPVAVKLLAAHLASKDSARKRFLVAASVLSRLNHPTIVKVHRVINEGTCLALIMELVQGPSLETVMLHERRGPWNRFEVRSVMVPVIEAIAVTHSERLVHRDLKPANILMSRSMNEAWPGTPKIIDFDLVRAPEGAKLLKTRQGVRMGTYPYMAPEQFRGVTDVDARADVFSLGMMLWQLLAGRLPVRNPSDLEGELADLYSGRKPIASVGEVAQALPPHVVEAVDASLSLDPDGRPIDAADLLARLGWEPLRVDDSTIEITPPPDSMEDDLTSQIVSVAEPVADDWEPDPWDQLPQPQKSTGMIWAVLLLGLVLSALFAAVASG